MIRALPKPAFITTVPAIGGAEGNLYRLIAEQKRRGIDPSMILVHSGDGVANWYRSAEYPVAEFTLFEWQRNHPWRYAQTLFQLILPILYSRSNIVHINHHHALAYSTRAATLARRPYIIHMRGVEPVSWVRANLTSFEGATQIIAVAQAVKQRLVEGGVTDELISVIYDGIDPSGFEQPDIKPPRFLSNGHSDDGESHRVGFVGRLVPVKGIPDFIQAASIVSSRIPNTKFYIVGTGPDDYLVQLQHQTRELGLEDRMKFVGFQKDIASILHALDVLVLATHDREGDWEEACPNIVLEAMASRTPVVGTASGGVVELLADERGLIVAPGESKDMAEGVLEVLSMDPDRRLDMVERANRAVHAQFTIEEQARRIREVYAAVLHAE